MWQICCSLGVLLTSHDADFHFGFGLCRILPYEFSDSHERVFSHHLSNFLCCFSWESCSGGHPAGRGSREESLWPHGELRLHPSPHLTLHLFDTHAPSICQGPTIFLGTGEQPIHSLSRCRLQARRERAGASVAPWRSPEDSVGGARGKAGLQRENTGMAGRGQARKALPAMLKGKI